MATLLDSKAEGVTRFASPFTGSHRYVISLKSEKVNIWLEERSSKNQWQTGFLSKEDYVTAANVFVDATAADYVSCFKQCLDCPPGEEDAKRKLVPLKGGKLQLELSLKIRLLRSARVISYTFDLQPVVVERIDVLESKLKDQQELLEKLSAQVETGPGCSLYVESEFWTSSKLEWKEVNSNFALDNEKTSIVLRVPGLYAFGAVVNHVPRSSGLIWLQKNDVVVQKAAIAPTYCQNRNVGFGDYVENYTAEQASTTITCLAQVQEGDKVGVFCNGTSSSKGIPSYLTAVRIGA